MKILAIIMLLYMIETFFKPRIDIAREGYLLWYGIKKRKFIKLL